MGRLAGQAEVVAGVQSNAIRDEPIDAWTNDDGLLITRSGWKIYDSVNESFHIRRQFPPQRPQDFALHETLTVISFEPTDPCVPLEGKVGRQRVIEVKENRRFSRAVVKASRCRRCGDLSDDAECRNATALVFVPDVLFETER